jgi:hypothetical protein
MFLGLPDPDSLVKGQRIRILLSSSKDSKKIIDSYCFVTSSGLFIFGNGVNVSSKSKKQKNENFFLLLPS